MQQPPLSVSSSPTLGNPPLQMNLVPRQPATLDEVLDIVMRLRTEHQWLTATVQALPEPLTFSEAQAMVDVLAATVHAQAQQRELTVISALTEIVESQRVLLDFVRQVPQLQRDLLEFRTELADRTLSGRWRRFCAYLRAWWEGRI